MGPKWLPRLRKVAFMRRLAFVPSSGFVDPGRSDLGERIQGASRCEMKLKMSKYLEHSRTDRIANDPPELEDHQHRYIYRYHRIPPKKPTVFRCFPWKMAIFGGVPWWISRCRAPFCTSRRASGVACAGAGLADFRLSICKVTIPNRSVMKCVYTDMYIYIYTQYITMYHELS